MWVEFGNRTRDTLGEGECYFTLVFGGEATSLGGELVGGETPWWRDDRIPSALTTTLLYCSQRKKKKFFDLVSLSDLANGRKIKLSLVLLPLFRRKLVQNCTSRRKPHR